MFRTTMLYPGIDQHARQITISLRDESGDVLQARQVSTWPERIQAFFAELTRECARAGESWIAVVEVCGFNDWLIRLLRDYRCHLVILIQPKERKPRKTDRRDAPTLSELLWVNRERFHAGKPVRGLRQVEIAGQTDQENRRLTMLRKGSQAGADTGHQQGPAYPATVSSAVGHADKDISHSARRRVASPTGPADDRPSGDERAVRRIDRRYRRPVSKKLKTGTST